MNKRHPVKACKTLHSPAAVQASRSACWRCIYSVPRGCTPNTAADLAWIRSALLIWLLLPGSNAADVFASWGLSIDVATKITANKRNEQRNRSCCRLTCLSLAFLQGRAALGEPEIFLYSSLDKVTENIAHFHWVSIIKWHIWAIGPWYAFHMCHLHVVWLI